MAWAAYFGSLWNYMQPIHLSYSTIYLWKENCVHVSTCFESFKNFGPLNMAALQKAIAI